MLCLWALVSPAPLAAETDIAAAEAQGHLRMAVVGSFNTLTGPGTSPAGLPRLLTHRHLRPPAMDAALVFEPLIARLPDVPFETAPVLAHSIEADVSAAQLAFRLHPDARFADGTPVTAVDVAFSLGFARASADPAIAYFWQPLLRAESDGALSGSLIFAPGTSAQDMLTIATQLAIVPEHIYAQGTPHVPVGSGPYRVAIVDMAGQRITYQRRSGYWRDGLQSAQNSPPNIAAITYQHVPDRRTARTLLDAGGIDLWLEYDARAWLSAYPPLKEKGYTRETLPDPTPRPVQGFVFNLRKPALANKDVRMRIRDAFDARALNQRLYKGGYALTTGFFDGSDMAAPAQASAAEAALMQALAITVDPAMEACTTPHEACHASLPDTLEVIYPSPALAPVISALTNNLAPLGITIQAVQPAPSDFAMRLASRDFDLALTVIAHDIAPGSELRDMWGSASANIAGSANLSGVADPAIDRLVEHILAAPSRTDLRAAVHLLDRLLSAQALVIPTFHTPSHRIVLSPSAQLVTSQKPPFLSLSRFTSTAPVPDFAAVAAAELPPAALLAPTPEEELSAEVSRWFLILTGVAGVLALLWAHVRRGSTNRERRPRR